MRAPKPRPGPCAAVGPATRAKMPSVKRGWEAVLMLSNSSMGLEGRKRRHGRGIGADRVSPAGRAGPEPPDDPPGSAPGGDPDPASVVPGRVLDFERRAEQLLPGLPL